MHAYELLSKTVRNTIYRKFSDEHNDAQKDTVRRKTNNCDPRKPPTIVIIFPEPRSLLNICIPANIINVSTDDTKNDVVVGRAVKQNKSNLSIQRKEDAIN